MKIFSVYHHHQTYNSGKLGAGRRTSNSNTTNTVSLGQKGTRAQVVKKTFPIARRNRSKLTSDYGGQRQAESVKDEEDEEQDDIPTSTKEGGGGFRIKKTISGGISTFTLSLSGSLSLEEALTLCLFYFKYKEKFTLVSKGGNLLVSRDSSIFGNSIVESPNRPLEKTKRLGMISKLDSTSWIKTQDVYAFKRYIVARMMDDHYSALERLHGQIYEKWVLSPKNVASLNKKCTCFNCYLYETRGINENVMILFFSITK